MRRPKKLRHRKELVAEIWDNGYGITIIESQLYATEALKLSKWLVKASKYVAHIYIKKGLKP
jgi:hypothetical protein